MKLPRPDSLLGCQAASAELIGFGTSPPTRSARLFGGFGSYLARTDRAMSVNGGIDLNPADMDLQTRNSGSAIQFNIDPVQWKEVQNARGFVPVIINIQLMADLRRFLERP